MPPTSKTQSQRPLGASRTLDRLQVAEGSAKQGDEAGLPTSYEVDLQTSWASSCPEKSGGRWHTGCQPWCCIMHRRFPRATRSDLAEARTANDKGREFDGVNSSAVAQALTGPDAWSSYRSIMPGQAPTSVSRPQRACRDRQTQATSHAHHARRTATRHAAAEMLPQPELAKRKGQLANHCGAVAAAARAAAAKVSPHLRKTASLGRLRATSQGPA